MPIYDQMKTEAQQVRKLVTDLINIDRNELLGVERLGKISFATDKLSVEVFNTTLDLFEELNKCNLDRFPPAVLAEVKNQLSQATHLFNQALNLTLDNTNPKQERDRIVNDLQNSYPIFFQAIYPIVSFATRAGTDFKKIEREAKEVAVAARQSAEKLKVDLEEHANEAKSILNSMRVAAAESGVSQTSIHFYNTRERHKIMAKRWLKALGANIIFLVLYSGTYLSVLISKGFKMNFDYPEAGMAFGVVIVGYCINFCNRQYASHRHLEEVNDNKINALSSFLAFVNSTKDEVTKGTVLQAAAFNIYSPPQTSYLAKQQSFGTPVMEVGRRLIDKIHTGQEGNA